MADEADRTAVPPEEPIGCSSVTMGLPLRGWDTIAIILMAVAADVCLYSHAGGTGAAVLLLVATIGLLSLAPKAGRNAGAALMLTTLLAAVASAWNPWGLLELVGWLAVIALAIKLHRPGWKITEIAWTVPWTALLAPVKLFGHVAHLLGPAGEPAGKEERPRRRVPLRVVLVPLLVIALFIWIFVAANPVIEQAAREISERLVEWLEDFWKLFSVRRFFFWMFWLLVFAALARPAVRSFVAEFLARQREKLQPPQTDVPDKGSFATAVATLFSVNILFLAFNVLDSVYLYFKATLPKGISYGEYSHRGCFWLTMGLLLSTAVIGVAFGGRLNFVRGRGLLRWLSYAWAIQNGVLAAGALRRLQMYIGYSGLTRLRIVGIYGVLLVVAGLALMVWKVRGRKNLTWLVRRDMLAFWIALVVLVLTPRDYICAAYNTPLIMAGRREPLLHLHRQPLSAESFPPLIPLLDYENKEDRQNEQLIRRGIASFLGQRLVELRGSVPQKWTEWRGSRAWALNRLEAVKDKIEAIVPADEWESAEEDLREYADR